jgi:formate dehydrogenase subunit gamma
MDSSRYPEAITALLDQTAYPKNPHYALAALQDVRAVFGHVPAEAVPIIAEHLGMQSAAVEWLLRDSAQFPGKAAAHQLRICQGAVCIGKGGVDLLQWARRAFGKHPGLQVVAGHCLGHCPQAPSVSLDGRIMAPADAETICKSVESLTD